ncbi:hypothetical protein KJ855_04720 [Patescibacteria group bacterium]|nr:hypothetical protein [Patescibacteria group bacterium]
MSNDRKIIDGIAKDAGEKIEERQAETLNKWQFWFYAVIVFAWSGVLRIGRWTMLKIVDLNTSWWLGDKDKLHFARRILVILLGFFVLMSVVLGGWKVVDGVFGLKNDVVLAGTQGMQGVKDGVDSLKAEKFSDAAQKFASASISFVEIKKNLEKYGPHDLFVENSLPGEEYENLTNVVDGLAGMTRGAKFLALALAQISQYSDGDFSKVVYQVLQGDKNSSGIFEAIDSTSEYIEMSSEEISRSYSLLGSVNESLLPEKYKQ